MSTDTPHQLPRTKANVIWFGGMFLLLPSFLYDLLGPNPPIIVSKETTYITAPLRPNGLPDYRKYLLETLRRGVTPENNAAIPFLQATGALDMDQKEFQAVCKEVGLNQLPSQEDVLQPVYGQQNRLHVEAWLKKIGQPAADEDAAYNFIGAAEDHPWRSEDVPALADWIHQNEKSLDLLVEGLRKPKYYFPSPSLLDGSVGPLVAMLLPDAQTAREASHALLVRAMWNLGERRPEKVWQGILAARRLGRLVSHRTTLVDQLVASSIDEMTVDATLALLGTDDLTLDQASQVARDLNELPPASCIADAFDGLERMEYLDAIIWSRNDRVGSLIAATDPERSSDDPKPLDVGCRLLNVASIDWNVAMREGSKSYDRLAAAARIPDWSDRRRSLAAIDADNQRALDSTRLPSIWVQSVFSRANRGELAARRLVALFFGSTSAAITAEDRNKTLSQLVRLAAAIAIYRAEHRQYPDTLAELSLEKQSQRTNDLYHDNLFTYLRLDDGYLLYSTGENGRDDGGSNEECRVLKGWRLNDLPVEERDAQAKKIPAGADDIAIRVPQPAFEWPKPVSR